MYKKIKNSSFMNLIWFILCALPFVLLLIYSIGFFNKNEIYGNNKYKEITLNEIYGNTLQIENKSNAIGSADINYNDTTNLYTIQQAITGVIYFDIDTTIFEQNKEYILDIYNQETPTQNWRISINGTNQNLPYILNTTNENVSSLTYTCYNEISNNINDSYVVPIIYENNYNNSLINKNYFNNINANSNYKNFNIPSNLIGYEYNNEQVLFSNEIINYTNWFSNEYFIDNNNIYYNNEPIKKLEIQNTFLYNEQEEFSIIYGESILQYQNYVRLSTLPNYEDITFDENQTYYEQNDDGTFSVRAVTQRTWRILKPRLYILNQVNYNIEIEDYTTSIEIKEFNYTTFLNEINDTLKTNGFISSAFLNLSTFFGVTNVYYSLACYYIEYLLVIALLHLAFDILYMLPNICHKFMEKLGGERD